MKNSYPFTRYVVVANLRQFLSSYDAALPHFLGARFAHNRLLKGYFGGGAGNPSSFRAFLQKFFTNLITGYAMTRETVRLFIERVYDKHFDICILGPNGEEDSYLGKGLFSIIEVNCNSCKFTIFIR